MCANERSTQRRLNRKRILEVVSGGDRPTQLTSCGQKSTVYNMDMKRKQDCISLTSLSVLSDDELLRRLSELLQQSRYVESDLVAHIGEVDARKLYAEKASSSMFIYCTEVLHLSEHEAYLRITVARASRRHPVLLEMLSDGRLHLSGIAKLAPVLTEENRKTLLPRAVRKSKKKIEELVAELSPKPDVQASMRKLPARRKNKQPASRDRLGLDRVPDQVPESSPVPAAANPAVVEPLSPARYKVQFTASAELHNKLERLRSLMRYSVPGGDLASIIEQAVTEKLERLESKRFAKTKVPRKSLQETNTSPSSRYIPAAVKRAVYARDQGQCRFVDVSGRRCTERDRLEFHHHHRPYGRGGDHSVENVQLACPTHNWYLAESDYGKELMDRHKKNRRSANRVSEPAAVYSVEDRVDRTHRIVGPPPLLLRETTDSEVLPGPGAWHQSVANESYRFP